ncbi:MAG: hypothetical protein RL885_02605 [Planctomycetota bacterium]
MTEGRSARRAFFWALLLALIVAAPAAWQARFESDDYIQLALLEERLPVELSQSRYDIYTFLDGSPQSFERLLDRGPVPWFAHPELRVRFWRPVTAAALTLETMVFGTESRPYHLMSLAWYLAAVLAVGLLLRELLPERIFFLALLIFAVASSHRQIVTWLASRYVSLSLVLGALAMWSHVRFRASSTFGGWLSAVLWILALLAGESSLGWLGFLVSWELLAGRRPGRWKALLTPIVIAVIWLSVYVSLGYGTRASGAYVNPVSEPLGFLAIAPARFFGLLACALFGFQADIWLWQPEWRLAFIVSGVLAIPVGFWLWRFARREIDEASRPGFDALTLGAVLALIPQTAGMIGPRSLAVSSVGGAALLGGVSFAAWRAFQRRREHRPSLSVRFGIALSAVLFFSHAIAAPVLWFVWTAVYAPILDATDEAMNRVEVRPDQDAVLLQATNPLSSIYLPARRGFEGRSTPRSWWVLSFRPGPIVVTRIDEQSFILGASEPAPATPFELILRTPADPLAVSDKVETAGFEAEVLEVQNGQPTRVRFTFRRPLESPDLLWLDADLEPVTMPAIGESIRLDS